jgi:PAS domain S-box-containing protein
MNGEPVLLKTPTAETMSVHDARSDILNALGAGVLWIDADGLIKFVNPVAAKLLGFAAEELMSQPGHATFHHTHSDGSAYLREECPICLTSRDGKMRKVTDEVFWRKDGSSIAVDYICTALLDSARRTIGAAVLFNSSADRKALESQLLQSRKLESVGQLAAGIAHEINTPIQYVGDNTRFVKESFASIVNVLHSHNELLAAAKNGAVTPDLIARADAILAASDLDYLCEQIPAAVQQTLEGVERVSQIVRAMKDFSHPGAREKSPADMHRAIQSTVTVTHNEWKYLADIKLELDPELPPVPCFLGEFNQSILNLIMNAAQAIGDVVGKNPTTKGLITIQTRRDGSMVEIRVADTGTGIPAEFRAKIFEPFFTTKDVGKGTGQGLSIVYGCIVQRHGGTITFQTEVGWGTVFIIRLPLQPTGETSAKPRTPTMDYQL